MPGLPLERMAAAAREAAQYHVCLSHDGQVVYDVEYDRTHRRQYVRLGRGGRRFPVAEAVWSGATGYGRRLDVDRWVRLTGEPLPDLLANAAGMLTEDRILAVRDEDDESILDVQVGRLDPRDNAEEFYRSVFGTPTDEKRRGSLRRLIELSQSVAVTTQIRVSRKHNRISSLHIRADARGTESALDITFSAPRMDVLPSLDEIEGLAVPDVTVPMAMLLVHVPTLGGWCGTNHGSWTQQAIDLIQDRDDPTTRPYGEIYHSHWSSEPLTEADMRDPQKGLDPTKHHPLTVGASCEDKVNNSDSVLPACYHDWFISDSDYLANNAYYFKEDYLRDYHHFGGEATGLDHEWYFVFRGFPPTTCGSRYYSARDWGYGHNRIDPNLNRMTFTEAIRQYSQYTLDGKRRAYLMLGHVLHLLQDVGEPDHAELVPHPGSAYTERDAYNTYGYCEFLATYAAGIALASGGIFGPIAAAIAWGSTYGICRAALSDNHVGYEKLINDRWDPAWATEGVTQTGILRETEYDGYFKKMSDVAKARLSHSTLDCPLGLGRISLPPHGLIPGLDPEIDINDEGECQKYYDLTKSIVPHIVGLSAGLVQHFLEIVNHPPIVERLAIVQGPTNLVRPNAFAFGPNTNACLRYDAEWVIPASSPGRVLHHRTTPKPLAQDRPAYVFVLFGPTAIGPETGGRLMTHTSLVLTGKHIHGQSVNIHVQLRHAQDSQLGHFYWGVFTAQNCTYRPFTLDLAIEGRDTLPHLAQRQHPGHELDSDPASVAKPSSADPPTYPLAGYEPGPDRCHHIHIAALEVEFTKQPDRLVVLPAREPEGSIDLTIQQRFRDCSGEVHPGRMRCPVTWSLDPQVRQLGMLGAKKGPPGMFGFAMELRVDALEPAKATLTVTRSPRGPGKYMPGQYEATVRYTAGAPGQSLIGAEAILVELL
ncbi:MAG: hypothetical protein JXQ73_27220 [Phycisphaerae bacterium]|nr:hypothetical protein [Phycisphaerae bacterium]